MNRVLAILTAGMLGLCGCGGGGGDGETGLTGLWDLIELAAGATELCEVTQDGSVLSGTMADTHPISGTTDGSNIAFTVVDDDTTLTFAGVLSVNKDRVDGAWVATSGVSGPFVAVKHATPPPATMTGSWIMYNTATDDSRQITITQSGDTLVCVFLGDPARTLAGSITGSSLLMAESLSGVPLMAINATLLAGNMTAPGTWENVDTHETGSLVFYRYSE